MKITNSDITAILNQLNNHNLYLPEFRKMEKQTYADLQQRKHMLQRQKCQLLSEVLGGKIS